MLSKITIFLAIYCSMCLNFKLSMIHELKEIDNRKFKYMEQWLARKMVIFESMNSMVQEMEVVDNMKFKQMENSFG